MRFVFGIGIAALGACLTMGSYAAPPSLSYASFDLDTLGGSRSYANAINNSDQIVGWGNTTGDAAMHAVLWNGASSGIDLSASGGVASSATAINDAGKIVGYVQSTTIPYAAAHAAVWTNGQATELGSLGGDFSEAWAINKTGQIAGQSTVAQHGPLYGVPPSYATLWSGGAIAGLSVWDSAARGINDAGHIVGTSGGINGSGHAALWTNAVMTDLGTLGGARSSANAINNAEQIVGWSELSELTNDGLAVQHATLWRNGDAIDLGTLGGGFSDALAINNAGIIVGSSSLAHSFDDHAVLWSGAQMVDLNDYLDPLYAAKGWVLVSANGINDQGDIVLDAYNSQLNLEHAFLLTPVPEPAGNAMMLVGLIVVAGFLCRREMGAV